MPSAQDPFYVVKEDIQDSVSSSFHLHFAIVRIKFAIFFIDYVDP